MNCFLFQGLNEDDINCALKNVEKCIQMNRGDELYRNGYLGILIEGRANIIRRNFSGADVTMRSIRENDVFGSASIFGEWNENSSSIYAITPCKVCYISEKQLKSIFIRYPITAFNYITFLSERIRFLNRKIDTFSAENTEQRVYEYMISQTDNVGRMNLELSMAELARRLRIGRSSLYRSIDILEKNGLIKREGKSFIVFKDNNKNNVF